MLLSLDYEAFDGEVTTSELYEWREAARKPEEPTMQVKPTPISEWHKMLIDRTRTACGIPLGAYASRDESYTGRLCEAGCFSPYELKLAADIRDDDGRNERARFREASDDSHLSKDIAESRAENRRRLDAARQQDTPKDK